MGRELGLQHTNFRGDIIRASGGGQNNLKEIRIAKKRT
jgi:hypothetical protein